MTTLVFEAPDFLEFFDCAFMDCVSQEIPKNLRNQTYNSLVNKVEELIMNLEIQKINFIITDEIKFMLEVYEIVEDITQDMLDNEKFLGHLQSFSKQHRDVTNKLLKHREKFTLLNSGATKPSHHCNLSLWHSMEELIILGLTAGIVLGAMNYFSP